MKVCVEVSGQGEFLYMDGPFDIPEDVWDEGQAESYLIDEGLIELGNFEGMEVITLGDLEYKRDQLTEMIKKMEGV